MYHLLLRKQAEPVDDDAQTMRRLWPMLPKVSVVDYKSTTNGYRTGDLDRLLAYVHRYYADESTRPQRHGDLCAVLVVPARTRSLDEDVADMGLSWEDLGSGYWRVRGGAFTVIVVEIRAVAEAENDNLLQSLGGGVVPTQETLRFWAGATGSKEAGMSMQDVEGYDEAMQQHPPTGPGPAPGHCSKQ